MPLPFVRLAPLPVVLASALALFMAPVVCHAQPGSAGRGQAGSGGEKKESAILPAQGVGRLDLEKLAKAKPSLPKANTCYVRGDGGAFVAKVLAELGKERLVKLPTGKLEVVAMKDTRPTTKPFKSASRAQIIGQLKKNEHFADFEFVGDGYYVFAYQEGSEATYLQTRSILTSLFPGVIAQLREWGLKPTRPETPMVVITMPSLAAFDALEPMPEGVAAYYSGLENYVILYEDTRLWEAAPEYAFKSASYTVAHEGIHQILANTGIQQRLSNWPSWMSEGLPEYFCPLRVNTKLIKKKDGELPERTLRWQRAGMVNDLRMRSLLRYRGAAGELVKAVTSARSLTADGYAVSWGLVHFLGTRRKDKFAAYLQELSEKAKPLMPIVEGGGTRMRPTGEPDPLFVKHFGDDYAMVEARVQRHLTSKAIQKEYRDPVLNQTVYVLKSTIKRAGSFYIDAEVTLSPDEAKQWKEKKRAMAHAEGREVHINTIVCDDMQEAVYHLRKLKSR
ncbi:MAG: DUF1570 domain-containing protein [Planctomycetota bacterium]